MGTLQQTLTAGLPAELALSVGEPGSGQEGWRLSHRQAASALPVARQRTGQAVRYADVPLLAAMLSDEVLATSLQRLYLAPLASERDGGETARETLRAYFDSGRNISSAAAALSVHRHTVRARLRAVEETLGTTLETCATELDAALRFEELNFSHAGPRK
jgi:DNA-binding PucR family transcriptional regulator